MDEHSGRFAAVCAARCSPPKEQKSASKNEEHFSTLPTPCSTIRDRQVLNRTPITNNNVSSLSYYSPHPIANVSSNISGNERFVRCIELCFQFQLFSFSSYRSNRQCSTVECPSRTS